MSPSLWNGKIQSKSGICYCSLSYRDDVTRVAQVVLLSANGYVSDIEATFLIAKLITHINDVPKPAMPSVSDKLLPSKLVKIFPISLMQMSC